MSRRGSRASYAQRGTNDRDSGGWQDDGWDEEGDKGADDSYSRGGSGRGRSAPMRRGGGGSGSFGNRSRGNTYDDGGYSRGQRNDDRGGDYGGSYGDDNGYRGGRNYGYRGGARNNNAVRDTRPPVENGWDDEEPRYGATRSRDDGYERRFRSDRGGGASDRFRGGNYSESGGDRRFGRGGGFRRRNFDDDEQHEFNDRFSRSVNVNDGYEKRPPFGSRVYRSSRRGEDDGGDEPESTRGAVTYIPPEFDDSEQSIFSRGVRQGINFDKYDKVKVKVTGGCQSTAPVENFDDLNVQPVLKDNIKRCNYVRPTPIQRFALPILLENRDIMACAQTGSGKTAAFILPIFDRILREDLHATVTDEDRTRCCHPVALVIVPTRELVIQTYAECKKFSYGTRIRTAQVYGGVSVAHQLNQLRVGNEVVVGTTGRLLDMIRRGAICLDECVFLVLDEADRMLDMGFEPDVREIIKAGRMAPVGDPMKRCTAMFSATFPPEVQTLAQDFLCRDYSFITVGVVGGACRDVTQEIIPVDRAEKRNKLKEILGDLGETKTLIFVEQKRFADFLASDLNQSGFRTTSIHGDRMQKEREEALRDFVRGNMPYLVATSVAARGLDIPGVDNVINYDLPDSITEYVHRIGRTGRCGNPGKSISFYDHSDERSTRLAGSLVNVLTDAGQTVPDFLSGRYFGAEHDEYGHRDTARQDIRGSGHYDSQAKQPPKSQPIVTQCNAEDDSWD